MTPKVPLDLPEERGSIFVAPKEPPSPGAAGDPDIPVDVDLPPEPEGLAPPEPPEPAPDPGPAQPSSASARPLTTPGRPSAPVTSSSAPTPGGEASTPATGEVLDLGAGSGSYSLIRRIGKGGMAEVWLARQSLGAAGLQRDVAVKRIRPDHLADDDDAEMYRKMFVDEARLAVALSHPGIAQVYDLQDRGDGTFYLVMEYVPGLTLRDIITMSKRKDRPLSPGLACYIIAQVADALHYAFNARGPNGSPLGIVHRDVNPKNIMLGQNGEVKLLDFGIAYSYIENRERTRTGVLKGTYSYMSPEQAEGAPQLDTRSDLFALGIMLTELLTGSRPFDAGAQHETHTIDRIRAADRDEIQNATAELDPEMQAMIARALARDPADRYTHGAELAGALRTYMMNAQLVCGPSEAVEELHELEEAPDVNATSVRSKTQSTPARVKIFQPAVGTSAIAGSGTPALAPPAKSHRASPTETRLQKRNATRDKLRKPEDAKPRLIKPVLIIAGVAIVAQLVLLLFIKLNHADKPAAPTVELVKTPSQIRAEQDAAQRAQEPQATRPQLADVHDPNTTLQTSMGLAPPLPTTPPPPSSAPATPASASAPSMSASRRRAQRVATAPPAEPAPAPTPAPAPVRRRSLDTSTATTYADTPTTTGGGASAATSGASLLPRGTLVPAALITPADANNPGPATASVLKDVSGSSSSGIVIPKGSQLVCNVTGTAGPARVGITCESVTVNGRSIALQGVGMGADQMRGIPVASLGGDSKADPARTGAIDIAGQLLRSAASKATGGGTAQGVTDSAVGAGQETTRRATTPNAGSLQPAPKGTHFFVFIHSIGGSP